ncbi:hypothetical protein FIU94_00110 [Sulfitobacter sp. THAF37]|uniref:surface lipoprotein assembly modifier n=1 Tax=Sulfitobacter sp. THAF37 TaxID=2587855 RepID=UPI00126828B4|nr:surface lipoprotein assembly modifier [Sulfitobacter sp. THAF37]QFT57209.1 hypothetical protein FIU94_00110 [Sulfitobacter sp. THAF37]
MTLRRLRRILYLAAVCGLTALSPGAHAEATLNVSQMRSAALQSLRVGRPAQADDLAGALLQRDPDDLNALLIRARARRDLGKLGSARSAAARAWQLAESDGDRYASALITAQILSTDGKRTRAQLWLRRAAQHAPNEALRARAKRDFRYVRQRNPWHTTLTFTLAPNSNINNGSARDSSVLNYALSEVLFGEPVEFELTGSARALSGLEFGAGLRSRYRFSQTDTTANDLNLSLSYRSFVLSDSSKTAAPGVNGSDFAFGSVGIGYGYRQINMDRRGEFELDAELGQTWYGGARYAAFGRVRVGQTWKRSPDQRLNLSLIAERQNGQRTADVDTLTLAGSLNQRLASGDTAYFRVGVETALSDTADNAYDEMELRGGYLLGRPVMGAQVQMGLGLSWRDYDVSRHSPAGRQDFKISADLTATFQQIDFYGFNPTATLSASKTDSNIGLFDVNRVGLNLGIRSAF